MEENEFIPNDFIQPEPTESNTGKKNKVKEPKKEKETKETKETKDTKLGSNLKKRFSLGDKIDKKKLKMFAGSFLTLLSVYLFLACLSYFFTWTIDQDRILDKGFFEFLFDSNQQPVENWLGKFGAWSSHFLIYKLFGFTSIGICFLMFISGISVLFDYKLVNIKRAYVVVLSYMIWGSLFLGFFAENSNYLGGTFGFYLNQWLMLTVGGIGTFAFIIVTFYVTTTLIFNPDYIAFFSKLFAAGDALSIANAGKATQSNQVFDEKNSRFKSEDDLIIHNSIREDQIKEDEISETVNFTDDEDEYEESELVVTYKSPEPETKEEFSNLDEDNDFEFVVATEDESIAVPTVAPTASPTPAMYGNSDEEELAKRLVKEFGEYDPTKDLDGFVLPPIELLKEYGSSVFSVNKEELESNKNRIVETLSNYKIDIAKIKATVGPTVTLYEIVPAPGVRISKIKNLEDDIALSLSALGIRIIAPIPGKGTIGIEVPNSNPEMVSMRSLIASEKFQNFDGELPVVMGKTITNETFVFDLTRMPHLLVAGATGQGKSVGLNAILISILYRKHPAQVKFVLVDPKKVELTLYNRIERHFLAKLPGEEEAIITDTSKVVNTLNSLCIEMDDRYELLKEAGVRTIKEYNTKFIARRLNPEKGHRYLPYIVVLIDEFADLIMTAGKEVEHPIARIAQLARAIGIHLIVATQRPSVNVITGMIKANFPARIAFRVGSKIDSRTILDTSGADQLIGRGDMLISTGSDMKRLQCGFVDTDEVEDICNFIGNQRAFPDALLLPEYIPEGGEGGNEMDMSEIDPMFVDSARIVVINQQGSASLLQRKLKLGYNRAGRIVDQLEALGIIGSFQGSKAREVLFGDIESLDDFLRAKGLL